MNVIHSKNYTMGSCPCNNNKNQALVPKFQGQLSTHTKNKKQPSQEVLDFQISYQGISNI